MVADMFTLDLKGFCGVNPRFLMAGVFVVSLAGSTFSQQTAPPAAQATSVLLEQAREMLAGGQLDELLPMLKELLIRLEGNSSSEALKTRAFCMYQIGVCYMQASDFEAAVHSFEKFRREFPDDSSAPTAALLTAESYALMQRWVDSERTASGLLQNNRFSPKEELMVRQLLAEALYRQQKWSEAVVPLLWIFEKTDKPAARSQASLMLAVCYAKQGDFANLDRFLAYCDTSVRQDAVLNMALIESGDRKSADRDFQSALKLYRMVLSKQELIDHYEQEIAAAGEFLKQPYVQRIGATRSAYDEAHRARKMQLDTMQGQLKTIREGANYDLDILLRMARCYAGVQRNWVAWTIYNHVYNTAGKGDLAEEARYQAFILLLNMPQEQGAARQEGAAYMERFASGKYLDEVSLNLMQLDLGAGNADAALMVGRHALQAKPDHRYIDQIRYLFAFIDFQKQEYETAMAGFADVRSRWPSGLYAEASEYWQAMCSLFLGQYENAVRQFVAYLENPAWKNRTFAEDASYRLGVALYGKGDYAGAEGVFARFAEEYPGSDLRSEAYAMLGDLQGAEGRLDKALEFYEQALNCAVNIAQENYAVFQKAKVLELKKDYPAIIALMEKYLKDRGEEGNFAGAGFWMGKSYKAMNQFSKAVSTYVNTVVRFGNVPANDNVDLILRELVKEYQSEAGQADKDGFMRPLNAALRQAAAKNEKTLELRLLTLQAYTSAGAARDRSISAILKPEHIEVAGALTLQLMAEEALQRGQYPLVIQVYDQFAKVFNESDLMLDLMNLRLDAMVRQARYADAVTLAEEITSRFGYQPQVGLTRKLKGDSLRQLKRYDEAVKTYNELFAVREWRGPLTPESLYWIGVCLEAQGKSDEAFAFFQRVYVLYEGYPQWVARAYEGNIRCLQKLGRTDDAVRTIDEMLSKPEIASLPEGVSVRALRSALVPAGDKK